MAEFNAYADETYAEEYLSLRLDTRAWDIATEKEKQASLQMASDDLDRLPLRGVRKTTVQQRRFPRDYAASSDVPEAVKQACVELALEYLKGADSQEEYSLLTRQNSQYATIREQRDPQNMEPHIVAGIPSLRAFNLMVPFLRDERGARLVRGS